MLYPNLNLTVNSDNLFTNFHEDRVESASSVTLQLKIWRYKCIGSMFNLKRFATNSEEAVLCTKYVSSPNFMKIV